MWEAIKNFFRKLMTGCVKLTNKTTNNNYNYEPTGDFDKDHCTPVDPDIAAELPAELPEIIEEVKQEASVTDYSKMTKAQLIELLGARGVTGVNSKTKAELIALIN